MVKATGTRRFCYHAEVRQERASDPRHQAALERLRQECADWPGVTETTSWGNPTFKANGRTFAVLDHYRGDWCIHVHSKGDRRAALLAQDGWFAAPYDRKQQSLCRSVDGLDWDAFREVLRESYESVMPG